jgi:hypothetical protein
MLLWQRARAHPFAAVFLLSLVVRLSNLALLRTDSSFFAEPDAYAYWMLGTALAKREAFWTTLSSLTDRMPLYPLLLAGIQSLLGNTPGMAAAVQAVLDAGTCTLIAALGTFVSPLTGLVAGILAAVSVTLVVFSTQLLTDTVFVFFFSVMLLAGAHFLARVGLRAAVMAGLAGGLALATRPWIAPLLIAAVPLVFTVAIIRSRRFGRACITAALFAAAAAVPVAPTLVRNGIYYGSFNLTSQAGDHLAFWIVPLVKQRTDGTPYETAVRDMQDVYEHRLAQASRAAQTNPFARAAIKVELARQQLERLPLSAVAESWVEGMVVNLAAPALIADPRVRALPKPSFYATPGRSLWERAHAYLFERVGPYELLVAFGIAAMLPFLVLESIGLVMLARTRPWAAALAVLLIAYFLLLNGPVASPKYRLPIEPVLIVLAAIPLARWIEQRTRTYSEAQKSVG